MKKIILFIPVIVLFFLYSCEKDLYQDEEQYRQQSKYAIKDYPLTNNNVESKGSNENTKITTALQLVTNFNTSSSKAQTNSFSIDSTIVREISSAHYTSIYFTGKKRRTNKRLF